MEHLKILQSKGILKNADSYILTNREKRELIDAFQNLSKINKIDLNMKANFNPHTIGLISKNLTLKEMINLSLTNKKMRETMIPIIENKKRELEELRIWLKGLPRPKNYTIEQLDQLNDLDLWNNKLTSFPNLNLPNLQELELGNNQLTSIPNLNLPNLQRLYLSNNHLKEFPAMSLNLPNLQTLYLGNNHLTEFPNLNLPNLQDLLLDNNQLTSFPNLNLPKLQILYLDNNRLTSFPNLNLPKLQYMTLKGNLLSEIEKERLKSVYKYKIKLF